MHLYYYLDGDTPIPVEKITEVTTEVVGFFEYNGGEIKVSTRFLGQRLSQSPKDGPPCLWETMVYRNGGWLDEEAIQYASAEEARSGHRETVDRIRDMIYVRKINGH